MDIYRKLFGKNLKAARKKTSFTQAELGEKVGVEPSTVSRWESGKDFPEHDKVPRIAKVLGVSLEELTGMSVRERVADRMATQSLNDPALLEASRVLEALAKASIPRRALIYALLYKDESYLEALPQEIARAAGALARVP